MKSSTNEQEKSYENENICYTCKEKFEDKHAEDKKYCKVRDHCNCTGKYRGSTYIIRNLNHSVPKEIPIVFCNGCSYDDHFIKKRAG